MKKIISILLALLLLVGTFAACTEAAEPEITPSPTPVETPEPEETPPPAAEGVTSANVQIHLATDELLTQFSSLNEFIEFDEAGHQRIVITTEAPLLDFSFVELDFDESFTSAYPIILHYQEQLRPEAPFMVTWIHWGTIPHRGILFTDLENQQRLFAIHQSGYDGALVLEELVIGTPEEPETSPHTPATGILEATPHAWTEIVVSTGLTWSVELEEVVWSETRTLSHADAQRVYEILSTMDATEVLTPGHHESQQTDPLFQIEIHYGDGSVVVVSSVEASSVFFRFTDTFGNHGDPGFVRGASEELLALLHASF